MQLMASSATSSRRIVANIAELPDLLKRPQYLSDLPPSLGGWWHRLSAAILRHRQPSCVQVRDTFLLKVLAVEAAILITVGVLAVMERDFFSWLFS